MDKTEQLLPNEWTVVKERGGAKMKRNGRIVVT